MRLGDRWRAAGIAAGFVADALFADPRRGHPVAGFGWCATTLERFSYRDGRAAGVLHTAVLVGALAGAGADADQVLGAQDRAEGLPTTAPLPRYAQVVLFGDFLEPPERIGQAIQSIAARGLRGQIVQVHDPAEEELPFRGRIRFDGFEGEGETLVRRVEAIRDRYRGRLAAHRDAIRDGARRAGWGFHLHRTDRPPESALLALYMALSPPAKV